MGLFDKLKKEKQPYDISAGITGEAIAIENVNDGVFSTGALGKGVGIIPTGHTVHAPVAGEITMLFPTLHAIGLKTDAGVEILIHIGIDTVGLEGKGFTSKCKQGQKVSRGQALIDVDFNIIEEANLNPIVLILIANSSDYKDIIYNVGNKDIEDIVLHIKI